MEREIIEIDEELCVGCGNCVPNCHQGALQIIDGKARLISDLMCEGLGACVGHCPTGAMTIEKRQAEPYDEVKVMDKICAGGPNVIRAHLEHLVQHRQGVYLAQALDYLAEKGIPDPRQDSPAPVGGSCGGGCPGSAPRVLGGGLEAMGPGLASGAGLSPNQGLSPAQGLPLAASLKAPLAAALSAGLEPAGESRIPGRSELRQWPVQLHLLNPAAPYLAGADLLLASDCSAFAAGNFHSAFLKGRALAIACPKLDQGQDSYVVKLSRMIDEARINTLTVLMMEVPCCGGLLQIARAALAQASRKVPIKAMVLSLEGQVIKEDWV